MPSGMIVGIMTSPYFASLIIARHGAFIPIAHNINYLRPGDRHTEAAHKEYLVSLVFSTASRIEDMASAMI